MTYDGPRCPNRTNHKGRLHEGPGFFEGEEAAVWRRTASPMLSHRRCTARHSLRSPSAVTVRTAPARSRAGHNVEMDAPPRVDVSKEAATVMVFPPSGFFGDEDPERSDGSGRRTPLALEIGGWHHIAPAYQRQCPPGRPSSLCRQKFLSTAYNAEHLTALELTDEYAYSSYRTSVSTGLQVFQY